MSFCAVPHSTYVNIFGKFVKQLCDFFVNLGTGMSKQMLLRVSCIFIVITSAYVRACVCVCEDEVSVIRMIVN
jgi:hypothetical protein